MSGPYQDLGDQNNVSVGPDTCTTRCFFLMSFMERLLRIGCGSVAVAGVYSWLRVFFLDGEGFYAIDLLFALFIVPFFLIGLAKFYYHESVRLAKKNGSNYTGFLSDPKFAEILV